MKRLITFFFACILSLVSCFAPAQQVKIDSLQNLLKTAKEDTSKVNILNKLCGQFTNIGSYEQALQYAQEAQQQAEKLDYKRGMANAYHGIGNVYYYKGNYQKALDNYFKSVNIKEEIGEKKGMADSYNNIGTLYNIMGNYEKALNSHLKSLTIKEKIGDKQGLADSYLNIGNVYQNQGNYEMALDNFLKSLVIKEKTGDKKGIAQSYNNIGNIYYYQGNHDKALNHYQQYLKLSEENGDKHGIATSYDNIGLIYNELGNFEKALDNNLKSLAIKEKIGDMNGIAHSYNNIGNVFYCQYEKSGIAIKISDLNHNSILTESLKNYLKSLKIYKEIGDKQGIAITYANIGNVYMKQGEYEESYHYFNQSLILEREIGYKEGIKTTYFSLSDLYKKKGDFKQAFNYHKLYSDIKDTLLNEQSNKQIAEMNTKYDSEKKDKELVKKDAEISKQQAETEKQNLQRNAFIIGFALVIVLAFFIFRGYRQKQSANKLLEGKNLLIEKQKLLVEEKNRKITDSINYAKRIQQAILPSQELIKSFLPESFIFFRPKDIVSGDFYWFSEKQDKLLIAIADCTGHGVPGAFMSMIGNTLLNEIVNVKNIVEPAQILNQLNNGIVSLLHQGETSTTQDDGMDITILSIDKTNNQIEFAGANHFSYLIKQNQLETLTGDIFSIGGMFGRSDINFTSKKISVQKGSTIYLFTDGFVDQFGGEKNTKFLSSRFEQLLKSIQQHNLEEQHKKLIVSFDDWKGNNKQLDDVLVVGIKI